MQKMTTGTEQLTMGDKWDIAVEMFRVEGTQPLKALDETMSEIATDLLATF